MQDMRFISRVMLLLTSKCNLVCHYCLYKDESYKIGSMPENLMIKSLDFIMKHADPTGCLITFFGGEPMLEFNLIMTAIKYIENKKGKLKIGYCMITNGLLFDQEKLDQLIKYNVAIQLSLDGIQSIHDKNRVYSNGKGCFFDLKRLFPLFVNYPWISTQSTFTPESAITIPESVRYFTDLGFTRLSFSPVDKEIWSNKDLDILTESFKQISDLRLSDQVKPFRVRPLFDLIRWKHLYSPNDRLFLLHGHHCWCAKNGVAISSEGLIYPCHRFINPNWVMGDVLSGVINDQIRDQFLEKNPSAVGCQALNYQFSGKINIAFPGAMQLKKIYSEVADYYKGQLLYKFRAKEV